MNKKLIPLLALLLVVLACEIPTLNAPASSTSEPVPLETIIAGTVSAAQAQTANALPPSTETSTLTPQPTATLIPTVTLTPTATVIFILPTATKPFETQSVGSKCILDAMVPYNPIVDTATDFSIQWTVRNTSDDYWVDSSVDFRFTGGDDMHETDIYDLIETVPPYNSVVLVVPMISPSSPGQYTTTWKLMEQDKTYCTLSATIIVK